MMMGKHHATTGMCLVASMVCLAVLAGYGLDLVADPRTPALAALTCAAHFLRPDIDHERAIASRCFGALSRLECQFWREASARYYLATRLPGDSPEPRRHRGLTHSPVGALLFGVQSALAVGGSQALCAALDTTLGPLLRQMPVGALWGDLSAAGGPGGGLGPTMGALAGLVLGVAASLLGIALGWFLAAAGAFPLVGILYCGACATLLAAAYAWKVRFGWGLLGLALGLLCGPALQTGWLWVAIAAAVGSYGHDLGDGCTSDGAPLRHPLRETVQTDKGPRVQRWADHGTPRLLRFRTGARRETFWVWLLTVGVGALVVFTVAVRLGALGLAA